MMTPASDQGTLTDRYALVPRTLIFLTRGERVLLLKGAAHKRLWAGRYNGIGGHVERGEDILSAAHRELFEETGLIVPDLRLCGVITIDAAQENGVVVFVLRGECPFGEVTPSAEGELEWVRRQDLATLPLVEDLQVLLPRALAASPTDAPFSAHYAYDATGKLQIRFFTPAPNQQP
ncbi:MAG: NUDIX domain-containing protein [Anaerolineales bacterium]|nr:NUDIX domain-containing protein [Anaerolineales bacterium]